MQEKTFREKWLEVVEEKNSVLCAGLDPAEFRMGRGEKGLLEGVDKLMWAFYYINAVAHYCAALKPNIQYWKNAANTQMSSKGGMQSLLEINVLASSLGLVSIDDSKVADIGSTNDAGFFYAEQKAADAVTFSPFAGNMQEAVQQAHSRNLGLISMVLMSNPEYEREKNKLVPISKEEIEDYIKHRDVFYVEGKPFTRQYIQLAHDANKFEVDGIVIGAPSKKNHIKEEEIATIRYYVSDNMLVLLPGVGAQGGEAGEIWKYFNKDRVIVNVGRGLMFPNGAGSTPEQQAEAAKQYRDMLNNSS